MNPGHSAVAAHRFGLSEATLATIGGDPRGWLAQQIGPADEQRSASGQPLPDGAEGLRRYAEFVREQRRARAADASMNDAQLDARLGEPIRLVVQADLRARLGTAATTQRPFAERLALFWANHFTVSRAKASLRSVVGAFEREAIRPHIAGRFEDLLRQATLHPAMLRYLDNEQSAGPRSRVALRRGAESRIAGLNENLARELLELHTLGAAAAREGSYTQADVTALAAVLTGWRVPLVAFMDAAATGPAVTRFDAVWHEPGRKTVLGQDIAEGADGLSQVLALLARHPATATHVATKLARHFVADDPPRALVERLASAYRRSDGDLPSVYRALLDAPEAWRDEPSKLKSPEEMVVSSARLLGLGARAFERAPDGGAALLGQRIQAAPSPAGWPDAAEEWLGPDAVWKRIEWATRVAERLGGAVDARALAQASLGPRLDAATARQIERAADGTQALALLLLAPEFQRR